MPPMQYGSLITSTVQFQLILYFFCVKLTTYCLFLNVYKNIQPCLASSPNRYYSTICIHLHVSMGNLILKGNCKFHNPYCG